MRIDAIFTDLDAHTLDPARPRAQKIGVFNNRIIGFDEELDGVSADRVESLGGATVLAGLQRRPLPHRVVRPHPGFRRRHGPAGRPARCLCGPRTGSGHDPVRRVDRAPPASPTATTTDSIRTWHASTRSPQADRCSCDRPPGMPRSSTPRRCAGPGILDEGFEDPVGGQVVRDAAGRPTGLLEETAQALVQDLIRPYSLDTLVEAIDLATAYYAKEGITSFGECGIAYGWIGHSPIEISAYLRARDEGKLRARAQLMPQADGLHPIAANSADGFGIGLDAGLCTGLGDDLLSIGPVKFFMDGATVR
jgi:hypothetical protein